MTNQARNPKSEHTFDLVDRTAKYGESVVKFDRTVDRDPVTAPLISQLVRSGTSIGANYMEADAAESKRDFRHKISLAKKEAQETMHWFRMVAVAVPQAKTDCRDLWREAHELTLIFGAILKRSNSD
jgi:four helix bundle protein